jgi:hypothetical protein
MQRFLLTVATATILQLPWMLSASAVTPLQNRVDSVHAQNPDIPALSAVIIRNGETLDSATMGLLDLDERIRVDHQIGGANAGR